jgi:hypothetical protein
MPAGVSGIKPPHAAAFKMRDGEKADLIRHVLDGLSCFGILTNGLDLGFVRSISLCADTVDEAAAEQNCSAESKVICPLPDPWLCIS